MLVKAYGSNPISTGMSEQRPVTKQPVNGSRPFITLNLPDRDDIDNSQSCYQACRQVMDPSGARDEEKRRQLTQSCITRIQTYASERDLTGLTSTHFRELAKRLILRGTDLIDSHTAKALQKNPALLEAMLEHAEDIARHLTQHAVTPDELAAALGHLEFQDAIKLAVSGGIGSLGFNATGATIGSFAENAAKQHFDEHKDVKVAGRILGIYGFLMTVADELFTALGDGALKYTKPSSALDNVAPSLDDLRQELTSQSAFEKGMCATAAVSAAYGSKNISRLPVNVWINHKKHRGDLTTEQAGVAKDMADLVLGTFAGASTRNLMPTLLTGEKCEQQTVLLDRDAAQNITDTVHRFVRPTFAQNTVNHAMYGAKEAALITAGVTQKMLDELMPLRWTTRVAAKLCGRQLDGVKITHLDHWLPPVLARLVSLRGTSNVLTYGAYTGALAYLGPVVDRVAKERNWTPQQADDVKEAIKPAIAMTAYIVMVGFSALASAGDKAISNVVRPAATSVLTKLQNWWSGPKEPPKTASPSQEV